MSITEIAWKSTNTLTDQEAKQVSLEWGQSHSGIAMLAILARSAPHAMLVLREQEQDIVAKLQESSVQGWQIPMAHIKQAIDAMMAGHLKMMSDQIRGSTSELQPEHTARFNEILADKLRELFPTAPIFRSRLGWREHT